MSIVTVSVCLCVCLSESISSELHVRSLPMSVHVRLLMAVAPWRRCDTLCTSGFMDDVTFAHNGQDWRGEKCVLLLLLILLF